MKKGNTKEIDTKTLPEFRYIEAISEAVEDNIIDLPEYEKLKKEMSTKIKDIINLEEAFCHSEKKDEARIIEKRNQNLTELEIKIFEDYFVLK